MDSSDDLAFLERLSGDEIKALHRYPIIMPGRAFLLEKRGKKIAYDACYVVREDCAARGTPKIATRLVVKLNTDSRLTSDLRIRLEFDWPAPLKGKTPLKWHVTARILEIRKTMIQVLLEKQELRTAGSASTTLCSVIHALNMGGMIESAQTS